MSQEKSPRGRARYSELNGSKNTAYQKLWDAANSELGNFIALNDDNRK